MTDTLFVPELRAALTVSVQQSDLAVPYPARPDSRLALPTIATFISAPLFSVQSCTHSFMQLGKDVFIQCCDAADMQSHSKVERFREVAQWDFCP